MSDPRDFFEKMVRPSYEDWLSDPLTEWKAKAATSYADDMAERMFVHWSKTDPARIAGAKSAREYRTHLRRNICPDFGLVWDVHDSLKHFTLDRGNRQVTKAAQTGVSQIGYGQGNYGEGVFGGADQIVIELDDRSRRALSGVMENVVAMWGKLLADMGL